MASTKLLLPVPAAGWLAVGSSPPSGQVAAVECWQAAAT